MADKKINIGNIVTPNGASLIFGEKINDNATDLSQTNAETWNAYTIIADEEGDDIGLSANDIAYTPPTNSQINGNNVQTAIDKLEVLIHDTVENSTSILIENWENSSEPNTVTALNQLTINQVDNQQIYEGMVAAGKVSNNELYFIPDENSQAVDSTHIFYATFGETTFDELKQAYDAHQVIACVKSDEIYYLSKYTTNKMIFKTHEPYDHIASRLELHCTLSGTVTSWTENDMDVAVILTSSIHLQGNASTDLSSTQRYYRPILISTEEPTPSDGQVGDIWIQYS